MYPSVYVSCDSFLVGTLGHQPCYTFEQDMDSPGCYELLFNRMQMLAIVAYVAGPCVASIAQGAVYSSPYLKLFQASHNQIAKLHRCYMKL